MGGIEFLVLAEDTLQPRQGIQHIDGIASVESAGFGWLCARDKYFLFRDRTFRDGNLVRLGVNSDGYNPFRDLEFLRVHKARQRNRLLHEFRPDRTRRGRSGKPKLSIIIETNPNGAYQIGSEAHKPAIV
jgi:hypothetical protein